MEWIGTIFPTDEPTPPAPSFVFEVFDYRLEAGGAWAQTEINYYCDPPGSSGFDRSIKAGIEVQYQEWLYEQFTAVEHTGNNQWWGKAEAVSQTSGRSTETIYWDNGGVAGAWVDLWDDWQLRLDDEVFNGIPQDYIVDVSYAPDNGAGAPDLTQVTTDRVRFWAYRGKTDYIVRDDFNGTAGDMAGHAPNIDRRNDWAGGTAWRDLYWDSSMFDNGYWRIDGGGRADSRDGTNIDALYVIDSDATDFRITASFDFRGLSGYVGGGIAAKVQDVDNFWLLAVKNPGDANPVLGLYKVASGTHTLVDSVTLTGAGPMATNAYYMLHFTFVGNEITGEILLSNAGTAQRQVYRVSTTDSAYTTEADIGLWAYGDYLQVNAFAWYDWPVGFNPLATIDTSAVTSSKTDTGLVYTNVYLYEGSNDPSSFNGSAGYWIDSSTVGFFDTFDKRLVTLATGVLLVKVTAVSGDTGRVGLLEFGTTPYAFGSWVDYYRNDISLAADNGEGVLQATVDITFAVDDGTGSPMSDPAPVTKRVTLYSNSTAP